MHVRDNSNNTVYAVIVDPGNGKVLYKQALSSTLAGGGSAGPFYYGGGYQGRGGVCGCR
jgi:hypothetical protein